jgi:pimeloyl-ACP methyl ester carboxylesterase
MALPVGARSFLDVVDRHWNARSMATPWEVRVLRLDDGRDLAFAEYGDPDGAVVFGFHGTPGSHTQFEPAASAAADVGVRLVVPDRPGYGHSTYDPHRALVDWPDDVRSIATALGTERFGVVGVSGGGPHAVVCAHALGDVLTGCALVGSPSPAASDLNATAMPFNRVVFTLARRAPWLLPVPLGALALAGRRLSEERIRTQMSSRLPEADARIMARPEVSDALFAEMRRKHPTATKASAQDFALFGAPWGFSLGGIDTPVDIWHGTEDVNVPFANAEHLAAHIAGSTLHVLAGEGHLFMYERASEILGGLTRSS